MAVNPYQLAGVQSNLLSSLMESEQSKKEQEAALGMQKGKMGEKFQKELIAAQQEAEAELSKKRKKKGFSGFLESIVPLLGFIPGVGTGLSAGLGALGGMFSMKEQSEHAQKQTEAARQAMKLPGMSKWKDTFLGQRARDVEAESKRKFDEMARAAEVSTGDLFKKGLTSGISSYAMGKVGEKIGGAIEGAKADVLLPASEVSKKGLEKLQGLEATLESGLIGPQIPGVEKIVKEGPWLPTESLGDVTFKGGGGTFADLELAEKIKGISESSGVSFQELLEKTPRRVNLKDIMAQWKETGGGLEDVGKTVAGNKDLLQSLLMALGPLMQAGEEW